MLAFFGYIWSYFTLDILSLLLVISVLTSHFRARLIKNFPFYISFKIEWHIPWNISVHILLGYYCEYIIVTISSFSVLNISENTNQNITLTIFMFVHF